MSNWFALAQFPLDLDLSAVDQVLTARDVVHRFTEEDGHQILWLFREDDKNAVLELLEQWRRNGLSDQRSDFEHASVGLSFDNVWLAVIAVPITCLVILLGVLGALVEVYALKGGFGLLSTLNFFPLVEYGDRIAISNGFTAILAGEVWRLITPTFIHFGVLHILFNGLWIWIFGQRIERTLGSSAFAILFLVTAVSANLIQAVAYGPNIFGGLSGVVYGLLGFIWVWQWRLPESILCVQKGVIIFMLIWLVLGFVGGVDFLVGKSVANGAHLGGLIAGILAGLYSTQRVLMKTKKVDPQGGASGE